MVQPAIPSDTYCVLCGSNIADCADNDDDDVGPGVKKLLLIGNGPLMVYHVSV